MAANENCDECVSAISTATAAGDAVPRCRFKQYIHTFAFIIILSIELTAKAVCDGIKVRTKGKLVTLGFTSDRNNDNAAHILPDTIVQWLNAKAH